MWSYKGYIAFKSSPFAKVDSSFDFNFFHPDELNLHEIIQVVESKYGVDFRGATSDNVVLESKANFPFLR